MSRCPLLYPAFLALAPLLGAQSVAVVENASVLVLEALDHPHQKTALHKHEFNRVMIYLTAGDLDVTAEDGHTDHQHWKAGDVAWSPAGVLHVSENVGAADLHIIEIEVRRPAPAASPKRDPGLDPVANDSKRNKLLFENPQVRVFRSALEVDGRERWHEHTGAGRLVVALTPLAARVEYRKRQSTAMNGGPGDVFWSEGPVTHRATNLGNRPAEVVVVEIK